MFLLEKSILSPKDYMSLRSSAGMAKRSLKGAQKGLGNEIYSVVIKIKKTNEIIGMGRIIGDGGTVFQICDMAVKSEWQNKGAGTMIMDDMMNYIEENAEENAYVNLLADVNGFYENWGFELTAPNSVGMFYRKTND
jgi:N-acetylglutamate synthase-like GNAT family acetyltransferase|tara:strand:+ start:5959 stop:6369 length:411 start_codon:yes stop_codon:yes gene_type:complete